MMTPIFSVLFSFSIFLSSAQTGHYIDWDPTHRLTWNDFKARPDAKSNNAALTSSSIDIKYSLNDKGLEYSIQCRFDKDLSWGRVKTSYILAHEQGHFDIAEVYARKLNRELKKYKFNNRSADKDVNRIYQRLMDQHHSMQKKYDHGTDFSRNKEKQRYWLKKIAGMLQDYKAYTNYKTPVVNHQSR